MSHETQQVTELHGYQAESYFLRFATDRLSSITGHLIGVKNSVNFVGTLSFCGERVLVSRSY